MLALLLLVLGIELGVVASLGYVRLRRPAARRGGVTPSWAVIVVPVLGPSLPEAALSEAAGLARATGARAVVLGALRVPRTMNLDADEVPGLDAALARVEAAELLVRRAGAAVHAELARVRELSEVLDRACAEVGARLVVLEVGDGSQTAPDLLRAVAERRGPRSFDVLLTGRQTAPIVLHAGERLRRGAVVRSGAPAGN
jgi:hypothetical protein